MTFNQVIITNNNLVSFLGQFIKKKYLLVKKWLLFTPRESPKYWMIRESNKSDYHVHFAEVSGVQFCALPFQSYYARIGDKSALVSRITDDKWNAMVLSAEPDGRTILYKETLSKTKDEVFYWAAGNMLAAKLP